jgi:hypothetical protein
VAAPVYSIRILAHGALTSSITTTVPDGLIYVARDLDVVCLTPSATSVVNLRGSNSQIIWYVSVDLSTMPRWQSWRGRQIFYPGEPLTLAVESGTFDVTLSGYQLSLP